MGRPINKRYLGPADGSFRIVGSANFGSGAEPCYIIRQRSVTRFHVARVSDDLEMTASLVEGSPSQQGQFSVIVDTQDGSPVQYARKITNTRVYTTAGNGYNMIIGDVASSDPNTANVAGLGGLGFTDVAISAAETTITADPVAMPANGSATSVITVQAKDAAGNDINNGGATVVLSTDEGTLLATVVDNEDGTYTQELEASEDVVTATVTGTINGETIGDSAEVAFEAL